ncbi:hypothetical protein CULT_1620010 [[Clostridium] ultunense Esp]|nr:hypothetical protein CULT_1620010 [[Clostridium] ultunense Esp]
MLGKWRNAIKELRDKNMIPFLDLKSINKQYKDELIQAFNRFIDSGWYILGKR